MSKNTNQSSGSKKSKLDLLKDDFDMKSGQLDIQQKTLNTLLSDSSGGNISEMGILQGIVAGLKQDLKVLKFELLANGVFPKDGEDQMADSQTIISAAAVRRKDSEALKLPLPSVSK